MPKRICPLEGNSELPALKMQPLRDLVATTWYMELAQADIQLPDYDDGDSVINPELERVDGIPLTGLDVKLANRHLLVRRMLKMLEQIVAHEDWENGPLMLVSKKKP